MGKEPDILRMGHSHANDSTASSKNDHIDSMSFDMLKLCKELSRSVANGNFDSAHWLDELRNYISNNDNRLLYSDISNYIFNLSDEEFTTFTTNLDSVLNDAADLRGTGVEQDKNLYKTLLKFFDHVNLAHRQNSMFSNKQQDIDNEIERLLGPKVQDITKDMTSQLVGLVSIFTALSFLIFGGISSLQNTFNSLSTAANAQNSILPTLIVTLAWAFCLMNLLFGFMYFVLRIVKPPVSQIQTNIVQRYPVVFLCDYVLLILFVVLCGSWFAERNGIGQTVFSFFVSDHHEITFIFAIVLIAVFFTYLGCKLYALYKGTDTSTKS